MASRIAICPLVIAFLPACAAADWLGVRHSSPLTTAQQIRALTSKEADEARPVKVTGVVTHAGSIETGFYLQDETSGIFVRPTPLSKDLKQGDRVAVEGVTDMGEFAPCIVARSIVRVGTDKLPDPQPFNLSINDSRWVHGQWVQAWVVVKNARSEAGTTFIEVFSAHGMAELAVPGEEWTRRAREMRSHAVAVRGVCVATFKNRLVSDPPTILLAESPKLEVDAAEPLGAIDAPPRMIDHLLQFSPRPYTGARRVKITGVVTAAPLHNLLIVQDSSGGAAVWTNEPTHLPIGAKVEAFGLLRVEGSRLSLTHSRIKRLGSAEMPDPAPISAGELANGTRDAIRVSLAGRAESVREIDGWTAISLTENGTRFEAFVPGTPEKNGLMKKVEPGARVALVGVPTAVAPDGKPPAGPGIFLRAEDAVAVLEPPIRSQLQSQSGSPWLTSSRAAYMFGGFATVLLLGGSWLVALRVQARRSAEHLKRQYEEKARLERQLREASKLEAVGRLAGGIAHDFNNLLTVINGCAELLADETGRDGGRLHGLTDDIRQAGERAASLTGQLLTFSRKREILISAVNLNDVVADTLRLLDRVIGEEIRIESSLAPDLPSIRGEAGLLHQVMMNLAVNAKDAMPNGGVLTIATSLISESAGLEGFAGATRQFVRLTVADTGVGMSEEVKARLFEPFFTTKEIGSGTGLGLATVYGIVKTLHGRIRVDSSVGVGTRFHIDLRVHGEPVSDAELSLPTPPTPLPPSRVVNVAKLLGKTVLVVEDNEMVRHMLVGGLKGEGANVLAAERPEHALKILADYPGPVDALVTDVVLPGMNGSILAERVRETRPDVRVVFMSGYTADVVLRQGVLEEQVEFLQKPFTPDSLIRRLSRLLARDETPA